ncbi:MAG: proline--tRNA ligase [Clostridia bacterium]|nr:proline--tRNA ligase [Clostridia bacterium]
MLLSKMVGERTKTTPSDATIPSHVLLLRAGYIKLVSNGIWSLATPARRITRKIENIIREEMDAVEGQEVSFPVVMPKELWAESGRYYSIGDEMVRFKDRCGRDMVLGMTHEEAAVHFARDTVSSYQQLPFMVYQLQTKFRDEARSRGGLIRVREFVMKDAYSFHADAEDLEKYYYRVYDAYTRIFRRIGMKRVVAVKSDSGMMGGNIAHEYMLLTPVGEDTIVLCPECGYKANMEVAVSVRGETREDKSEPLSEVFTADKGTIEEVCDYLKAPQEKSVKAVCYFKKGTEDVVVVFIRGDLEVNESKLKKVISSDIVPANLKDVPGFVAGNIGPVGLKAAATVVYDESLRRGNNLICGANKPEYHFSGLDMERDLPGVEYVDVSKVRSGERCPVCGKPLSLENGIEVGNIFQLGTKYTKAMNMTVLDKDGKAFYPIMGCYGIGVGRALASVAEESHDDKGLIWPMTIAPWQVYLCGLRLDDENVKDKAFAFYEELQKVGVEVLFDDRNASAGFKFYDCDLMGIPLRVVISPRSLEKGQVEIQSRDKAIKEDCPIENACARLKEIIAEEIARLS